LNLKLLEVPWSPQGQSAKVEAMSLAIKLLGVTGLCVLCCALPATLVFAAGFFEVFWMSWGLVGGIALLIGIAALSMIARRTNSASNSCRCSPPDIDRMPELGPRR
jgi:hypothetical protein